MAITDINPPALLDEPVTLDYAKVFLRVDNDDEDALIADLIRAARERVEGLINSALMARARRFTTSKLKTKGVFINSGNITEITAMRLLSDDAVTEISLSSLTINLRCQPPVVTARDRASFQSYAPQASALEIDFIAGYGADEGDIPMPLRQAVLLLLAQSYEYRGSCEAPPTVPMMVDALLMPYRGMRI